MSAPRHRPSILAGLPATLGAALAAALTAGLLFGLVDALVADARIGPPDGLLAYLGCAAAAVMAYSAVHAVVLLLSGLALHPFLRVQAPAARLRVLLSAGLSAGLFLEIYWWTRPFVFYGESSVSPKRLAAAGVQAVIALALGWWLSGRIARLPRRVHLAVRTAALACVAGGLAFVASESARGARRGTINERNRDLPNVLLVVVDALRADVLGCYGSERVKTPVIDALAAEGVLFESYRVQAPYTWTSFGSMFTGKYPRRHGLLAQEPGRRMVRDHVTLPLHLKTAARTDGGTMQPDDWTGGAFMTGALSNGSGLARGFDVYAEAMMGHDVVEAENQWSVFRSELLLWLFKSKLEQRVDSSLVVTLARRWMRANAGRRWVAFVHLYSTHTPYDPPEEFRRMYVDPAYDGPIQAFYADYRHAIEKGEYEPTQADVEQIRNLYYAGVSQADSMIGELLGELEALGIREETLVIVTSDHGEDLGERPRCWEHNHMWQTNLAAPFVLAGPDLPRGRRVNALVESVDLLPTVCDLLGLELPPEDPAEDLSERYSLIDGRSMLPLLAEGGDALPGRTFSFAENALHLSIQDLSRKLIVPRALVVAGAPEALFDPRLREEFDVHYFDLAADPDERVNLAQAPEHAASMRELFTALATWSHSLPVPVSDVRKTARDEEQRALLRDLGYTGDEDDGDEE